MLINNNIAMERLVNEFDLSSLQAKQFAHYVDLVEAWTLRKNLVSKKDRSRIVDKHIFESLEIVKHKLIAGTGRLLDVGSGAGFPGLPLAIMYPELHVVLAESKRMRALFLREAVEQVRLSNTTVVCERVEKLGGVFVCDYVSARAVASLADLWRWSYPLLKPDGILIALKGGQVDAEINELLRYDKLSCKIISFCGKETEKKIVVLSQHELSNIT
ncbi:16S rRNA (guanine(527)-N(7))-methyltransferase RsmG [candidate division KSB1 bacterium]|nr:16S rRNA (guanine(527)-N(7))-methyltransferase RsmG [candidate division KSB1 bacterium]